MICVWKNVRILLYLSWVFCFFSCSKQGKTSFSKVKENFAPEVIKYDPKSILPQFKSYCIDHSYNDKLGVVIHFGMPSGSKRFFLCDLETNEILVDGLVCHGSCNERFIAEAKFGNEVGCGCSSLGHYKIGEKYNGDFGTAYKLYGLDETNSNAYVRFVVLHGHSCVPEHEYNGEICNSLGCPTLNPEVLKKIEPYLDKATRPIIIWAVS